MNRVLRCGVNTPAVYLMDETERKIYMEYLGDNSMTLKEFFK